MLWFYSYTVILVIFRVEEQLGVKNQSLLLIFGLFGLHRFYSLGTHQRS